MDSMYTHGRAGMRFQDAISAARKHFFNYDRHDVRQLTRPKLELVLKTKDMEICAGDLVVISEESWNIAMNDQDFPVNTIIVETAAEQEPIIKVTLHIPNLSLRSIGPKNREADMSIGLWTSIGELKTKIRDEAGYVPSRLYFSDGKVLDERYDGKTCEECGIKTGSVLQVSR